MNLGNKIHNSCWAVVSLLLAIVVGCAFSCVAQTGSLTDARDGKTYSVLQVNDSVVWMAEGLRWESDTISYESENCGTNYLKSDVDRLCPEGWRIPSYDEFLDLLKYRSFKEYGGWEPSEFNYCAQYQVVMSGEYDLVVAYWVDFYDNARAIELEYSSSTNRMTNWTEEHYNSAYCRCIKKND